MLIEYVAVSALLGFILGWEGVTHTGDETYLRSRKGWVKFFAFALFGVAVAGSVNSIRGFFVVYLASFGTYYLVRHVGEIAQVIWYRWRDPHPNVKMNLSNFRNDLLELWVKSRRASTIHIETILIKNSLGKPIPITTGIFGDRRIAAQKDGWLRLSDMYLGGNGLASVQLESEFAKDVVTVRFIGSYANGSHWVADAAIE